MAMMRVGEWCRSPPFFCCDPLGQRWSGDSYRSKHSFPISDKPKLLTTTQAVSFWVGLISSLSLWVQLLLRWTHDGVIALQPVTLTDYILILGLFVAVPLVVIALFVGIAAFVALRRAWSFSCMSKRYRSSCALQLRSIVPGIEGRYGLLLERIRK